MRAHVARLSVFLGLVPCVGMTWVSPAAAEAPVARRHREEHAGADEEVETETDDESDVAEQGAHRRRSRRVGVIVRGGMDLGHMGYAQRFRAEREAPGLSTEFAGVLANSGQAWGGSALLGLGIRANSQLAVVPHVAGSLAQVSSGLYSLTIAGADHQWTTVQTYWALAAGSEFQFASRLLFLSIEVGLAGLELSGANGMSPGLTVAAEAQEGALGRMEFGVRLPRQFPLGAGFQLAGETFWTFSELPAAYRLWGGVFVEFDSGRFW